MKKLSLLVVALGVLLTLGVSAVAAQDPPPPPQPQQQPAAQEQTVRGKVTSVSATAITIELEAAGDKSEAPKTMEFVTDSSTKTEGKVESGVIVTITYRAVDGQNVATR